jgi:hypothetical protein
MAVDPIFVRTFNLSICEAMWGYLGMKGFPMQGDRSSPDCESSTGILGQRLNIINLNL